MAQEKMVQPIISMILLLLIAKLTISVLSLTTAFPTFFPPSAAFSIWARVAQRTLTLTWGLLLLSLVRDSRLFFYSAGHCTG